jgi:hypothetical protein
LFLYEQNPFLKKIVLNFAIEGIIENPIEIEIESFIEKGRI